MLQCSCFGFPESFALGIVWSHLSVSLGLRNLKTSDGGTQAVRKGSETRFDASYALELSPQTSFHWDSASTGPSSANPSASSPHGISITNIPSAITAQKIGWSRANAVALLTAWSNASIEHLRARGRPPQQCSQSIHIPLQYR
jgi:hypothetical protein